MWLLIVIVVIILLVIGWYTISIKTENFCGSCVGPIAYRFKFGDPFYRYQYEQRTRYQKYPKRVDWMNLQKNQRETEKKQVEYMIEKWIKVLGLNEYGDPPYTKYPNGNPLVNKLTNNMMNKYTYIINKHSDRPWENLVFAGKGGY